MNRSEELPTAVDGLTVSELRPADAHAYHGLVQRNVAHLTQLGDYLDEVAMSLDDVATAFADDRAAPGRFGIRLDGALVGRVDLVPVDPPRFRARVLARRGGHRAGSCDRGGAGRARARP